MPYLRVETNVAASKAECLALAKKLTETLVKALGKPAKYISVGIIPDMALVFGGTEEPCAQLYLGSIGVLGKDKNAEVSAAIAKDLEDFKFARTIAMMPFFAARGVLPTRKIPADRHYIYFVVQERHEVGWNGATF